MKKTCLLFSAILLSVLSVLSMPVFSQSIKPIQIVLFAGQSNMAGAGNYQALTPAQKLRVKQAAKRIKINRGKELVPLTYAVSKVKAKKYGFTDFFGPDLFVGVMLAEKYPEQEFIFLKTAVGGTSLYGAWNPNWSQEKINFIQSNKAKRHLQLLPEHLGAIKQQLARLKEKNQPYEIKGLLWMQGETDTRKAESADAYYDNLKNLLATYRKALNTPKLPFIMGQVNMIRSAYKPGIVKIRAAIKKLAKEDSFADMVPTSIDPSWADYPKHKDATHYNTEGQYRLGQSFGNKLIPYL